MKKIIVAVLLFSAATTMAQNDTVFRSTITAFGKPAGKKVEMNIGKEGDSIRSADGNLTLIIPEGAVTKKTNFSIAPLTNLLPNGNGLAYRLEPSGIQFRKPVELIFHYDAEEVKDSTQLLLGIGMQDETGQWHGLKNTILDTLVKTVGGSINHFSTWASFEKLKLYAPKRMKVKKEDFLMIYGVSEKEEDNDNELAELNSWKAPVKTVWRVNDIVKGNIKVGMLQYGERDVAGWKNIAMNRYTAPASLPEKNPVALSVDLTGASYSVKINKRVINFKNLTLVAHTLIYDNAYEVTMVSGMQDQGSYMALVYYKDTGSFVVSVTGKEARLIEKENKNLPDNIEYRGACKVQLLQQGSGNIHILGVSSIKVIPPATANDNAWVEIFFKRAPTILPLLQFTCPPVGGKGKEYTGTTQQARALAASLLPAFPTQVKFEAKEGEQTIILVGKEGGDGFLKITVKKLKDE